MESYINVCRLKKGGSCPREFDVISDKYIAQTMSGSPNNKWLQSKRRQARGRLYAEKYGHEYKFVPPDTGSGLVVWTKKIEQ